MFTTQQTNTCTRIQTQGEIQTSKSDFSLRTQPQKPSTCSLKEDPKKLILKVGDILKIITTNKSNQDREMFRKGDLIQDLGQTKKPFLTRIISMIPIILPKCKNLYFQGKVLIFLIDFQTVFY